MPAFAQQDQGFLKAQLPGRHIGDQDRPIGQTQGLLGDRLLPPLGISQQIRTPLVANRLGYAQHQQAHGDALAGSHPHMQFFHLPDFGWQDRFQPQALSLWGEECCACP